MARLRADERAQLDHLYGQSLEKLTAAQVRGFESLEVLQQRFRAARSSQKNRVLVELLKLEPEDAKEADADSPRMKAQLERRKEQQLEVREIDRI